MVSAYIGLVFDEKEKENQCAGFTKANPPQKKQNKTKINPKKFVPEGRDALLLQAVQRAMGAERYHVFRAYLLADRSGLYPEAWLSQPCPELGIEEVRDPLIWQLHFLIVSDLFFPFPVNCIFRRVRPPFGFQLPRWLFSLSLSVFFNFRGRSSL